MLVARETEGLDASRCRQCWMELRRRKK